MFVETDVASAHHARVVVVDVAAVNPRPQHVAIKSAAGAFDLCGKRSEKSVHLREAVPLGEARRIDDAAARTGRDEPRLQRDSGPRSRGLIGDRGGAPGEEFPEPRSLIGGVAQMKTQQQFVIRGHTPLRCFGVAGVPQRRKLGVEVLKRPRLRLERAEILPASLRRSEPAPDRSHFSGHACTSILTAGSRKRSMFFLPLSLV